MMKPLAMRNFSLVTSIGAGRTASIAALRAGASGLAPCRFELLPFFTHTGEVPGLEDNPLTGPLAGFDCRNNRLALMALEQDGFLDSVAATRAKYGASRIGVFAGTSTSGLLQTEQAYRNIDATTGALPKSFDYDRTHNTYSLARFVRTVCGLSGPAFVVSTACAATAKVYASAARFIAAGIVDAAIVGGADTLCATTLQGFFSLGVMAEDACRPFDANRRGISIGEAAGFALLERPGAQDDGDTVFFSGAGESADAYHMSSPHPEGEGAFLAMQRALAAAGLEPEDIDYINLHGTATIVGDSAEDHAVFSLFGDGTPCSSTKGFAGHTLGASGAVEAAFCALAIQHGFMPGSPHTHELESSLRSQYVCQGRPARIDAALSNSFGFGGSNCSLVFRRAA
jgi:3-oxoacyl-[acyl-carrier-protein] synthase-1